MLGNDVSLVRLSIMMKRVLARWERCDFPHVLTVWIRDIIIPWGAPKRAERSCAVNTDTKCLHSTLEIMLVGAF